jgi:hypothetical protein
VVAQWFHEPFFTNKAANATKMDVSVTFCKQKSSFLSEMLQAKRYHSPRTVFAIPQQSKIQMATKNVQTFRALHAYSPYCSSQIRVCVVASLQNKQHEFTGLWSCLMAPDACI